ncbi:MAG: DUF2752 domain-containing protein [Acholeplasmatales bacterium]|nr:DUF2752 domain-containing protein [Acholeplasmatales bacterium]
MEKKYKVLLAILIPLVLITFVLLTFIFNFECPFHYFFHLLCPFCGGRTMLIDLYNLRIIYAFMDNQLLFLGIPTIILLLFIKYILKKDIKIAKSTYILLMIITIAFTIIRNIV